MVAAPGLHTDDLAAAGHADPLLGRLVALHLGHCGLTLLSMQRSACLPSRRAWSSRAASSPAASPCARLGVLEPPGWRPEPPVPSRLPAVPPGSLALAVPPGSSGLAVPPGSAVLAVPPATLVPPAPVRRVRPRRARRSRAPPRRPGRSSPPASVAPSLPCRLPAGA